MHLFLWSCAVIVALSGFFLLLFAGFCSTPWEAWQLTGRVLAAVCLAFQAYRARGYTPQYPEWPLRFEVLTAAMRVCTRTFGHRIILEKHARYIRRQSEVLGTLRGLLACWRLGFTIQGVDVHGLEHVWLRRRSEGRDSSDKSSRLVVMYVHGGGYSALSPRFHIDFCVTLANGMMKLLAKDPSLGSPPQVDAFLVNYRKVPESPYPAAEDDVLAMYGYLLHHEKLKPEQILFSGDCTGAELVLATLLHLRSQNGPSNLPLGAILACPVVDVAALHQEDAVNAEHCILSASLMRAIGLGYLPTAETRETWKRRSSTLHSDHDLSQLPPVFVQVGGLDYLLPQARRLMEKAVTMDQATQWEIDVHDNMPHVFTSFPAFVLPYANVGIRRMAEFGARLIISQNKVDRQEAKSHQKAEDAGSSSIAA
ncbi:hypothetical protein BBJ28_00026319 [Nothophytophthora sp. Chile5]|nr:hypothetical protein BBJ28_00026319 [Nothophytophthora sp. Chile5]